MYKRKCDICEGSGGYMRQTCKKCFGCGYLIKVKIIEITTEQYPNDYQIISGGRDAMTWKQWQNMFTDEYKIYWEILKQKIIDENLIGKTGEWQDNKLFKFSDGKTFAFSWRGWGDFMSAIVGRKEGYMKYYM